MNFIDPFENFNPNGLDICEHFNMDTSDWEYIKQRKLWDKITLPYYVTAIVMRVDKPIEKEYKVKYVNIHLTNLRTKNDPGVYLVMSYTIDRNARTVGRDFPLKFENKLFDTLKDVNYALNMPDLTKKEKHNYIHASIGNSLINILNREYPLMKCDTAYIKHFRLFMLNEL